MPIPIKHPKLTNKNGQPRQRRGQHTLEYIILMVLVMAGIIVGGPYAIRSWNAQMKGWEDSVVDSMTDPLVEAPPTSVNIPGCDLDHWADQNCGLGYTSPFGDSISCPEQRKLQLAVYVPNNCQFNNPYTPFNEIAQCVADSSFDCCTPWALASGCDTADPGCPQASDCGVNAVPTCPDGQYRHTRDCDEIPAETESGCVADPDCDFTCNSIGLPGPNGAIGYGDICPGSNTSLPDDTNYSYTDPGNCTGTKCQIQCSPTFTWNGTTCSCPLGWNMGATICCPSGSAEVGGVCVPVCSPLINVGVGNKTSCDCEDEGGTVVNTGSGLICGFTGNSCPVGWKPHNNWSLTSANTCSDNGWCGGGGDNCTTSFHTIWANTIETCNYAHHYTDLLGCHGSARTCSANTTSIGCHGGGIGQWVDNGEALPFECNTFCGSYSLCPSGTRVGNSCPTAGTRCITYNTNRRQWDTYACNTDRLGRLQWRANSSNCNIDCNSIPACTASVGSSCTTQGEFCSTASGGSRVNQCQQDNRRRLRWQPFNQASCYDITAICSTATCPGGTRIGGNCGPIDGIQCRMTVRRGGFGGGIRTEHIYECQIW